METVVRSRLELAPLTTLRLGGAAEYYAEVETAPDLERALEFAYRRSMTITVLGGGSNVVVADRGVTGLILAPRLDRIQYRPQPSTGETWVRAEAGVTWDSLVEATVARGLAGLECLSGIPGLVGAVPIQNVGAYGREVGPLIREVELIDLGSGSRQWMPGSACGFGYRDSHFRRQLGQALIVAVTFILNTAGAPAPPTYAELEAALLHRAAPPTLRLVRDTVLTLRRRKSMLVSEADVHSRSVGSFFQNPVVDHAAADQLAERCARAGLCSPAAPMPRFALDAERCKVPAAWLIERAGFPRGTRHGAVGLSPRHALSLVHYGGGSTQQLLALAGAIQGAVEQQFAVTLLPEPVFLGFEHSPLTGAVYTPC